MPPLPGRVGKRRALLRWNQQRAQAFKSVGGRATLRGKFAERLFHAGREQTGLTDDLAEKQRAGLRQSLEHLRRFGQQLRRPLPRAHLQPLRQLFARKKRHRARPQRGESAGVLILRRRQAPPTDSPCKTKPVQPLGRVFLDPRGQLLDFRGQAVDNGFLRPRLKQLRRLPVEGLQFHPEATQPIAASWLPFHRPPPGEEITGPLFRNPDGAWDRAAVHAARLFSAWLDGDLAGP